MRPLATQLKRDLSEIIAHDRKIMGPFYTSDVSRLAVGLADLGWRRDTIDGLPVPLDLVNVTPARKDER